MKTEAETITILKSDYDKLLFDYQNLSQQLRELQRIIFGSKSERFIPAIDGQIDLFTQTALVEEQKAKESQEITYTRTLSKKEKKQPVRAVLPAHLPRVEEIIEPYEIEPGSKKIGEEVTEILEYNPANIYVRKIVRPKYAKPDNKGVIIANMPSLPLPKSNAGASMLAQISVSKYIDHLPFYRQQQIFKRQQLDISPSTMGGWFSGTAKLLELLYQTLQKEILKNTTYLQADESPIGVQDSHKKGALHQGYMWLFRKPETGMTLFVYNQGRSREAPEDILKDFTGTLQTDGYKVYQILSTKGQITLLGCMAHARRYFEKALDNDKKRAEYVLTEIQKLYEIERDLKEIGANYQGIKIERQKLAIPILTELKTWLEKASFEVLPKSAIGKAIAYTLKLYTNLSRYVEQGMFEIDNNKIENAVRPLAIGRKNYLFAGSHHAAQNAAMMYSFFASCKQNDINPFTWLHDVLHRINEHKGNKLSELLPNNWTKLEKK